MRINNSILGVFLGVSVACSGAACAADDGFAPGGTAANHTQERYPGMKVVMDAKISSPAELNFYSTVANRLLGHPGTRLVIVVEGPAITAFAKANYLDHQGVVDSFADLANKGVKIEYCGNSVAGAHLRPEDMIGLSEKNVAVVNPGAFPSIAHYETLGYVPISPAKLIEQIK